MPNPTPPDEELKNQIIQFQKDTLAEWDNPLGRNVDMIKLAYKFAALIHDREAKAERRGRISELRGFEPFFSGDHRQCPDPMTCIGYQNAQSDYDNEREIRINELLAQSEQEGSE